MYTRVTFYHISAHFRNTGFRSVSKPRRPVFIFRTGPTTTPYGSNWGHKIADFEFLPYISFIVAFIPSECIKRYWESICGESK